MIFGFFSFWRVAAVCVPADLGCPAFAGGAGQGVAELLVFLFQAADAVGGGFQAAQQRSGGCALPAGNRAGSWPGPAEPFDLAAEVVLGVEPASGDAGLAGEAAEGGWVGGGVHLREGAGGSRA